MSSLLGRVLDLEFQLRMCWRVFVAIAVVSVVCAVVCLNFMLWYAMAGFILLFVMAVGGVLSSTPEG